MPDREATTSPFAEELARLLAQRGLSWRKLADLLHYTPGWLSKIKNGTPPSAEFAARCDQVLDAGGRLIALAGVEATLRPAQVPASTARFVGRDRELAEVTRMLLSPEQPGVPVIVAIDGPAGAGKTALALRVAHEASDRFPDGQLYVDLRGYAPTVSPARPGNVLEEFLTALGVATSTIPPDLEARAKLYRSILAAKRVLVVLDNAASSEQVEPLLPGEGSSAAVVTSRKRLSGLAMRSGALHQVLDPMSPQESASLLQALIGPRAKTEPDAIADLARRCGYLPLALRIAAERVATHPQLRVGDLVDELVGEESRLDGLEVEDLAVRTVFSWSYRDLSADAARMFRLLGLYTGAHVGVGAAAALAAVDQPTARRLLERLASVHIIEAVVKDRYRLHDLLREYAAERAEAEDPLPDRIAAATRVTDWYLHTTAAAGRTLAPYRLNPLVLPVYAPGVSPLAFDDDAAALRWCDAELANFTAAVKLAVAYRLYDTAWKLAVALWDYLLLRKAGRVWISSHELALYATQASDNRYAEGWVATNLAEGFRWRREYTESKRHYELALAIRQEINDDHGQAWALAGSAFLAVDQHDADLAEHRARQALAMFLTLGDREGQAGMLATIGDVHRLRGQFSAALEILAQALEIAEELDDSYGQALVLTKIAEVHLDRGEAERALDYLNRCLPAHQRAGNRWGEADTLSRRATILHDLHRDHMARQSWTDALALYEEVEDPRAEDIRTRLQAGVAPRG